MDEKGTSDSVNIYGNRRNGAWHDVSCVTCKRIMVAVVRKS